MVQRKLWAVAQQSKSNSQAILKNSALIELCLMSAFTELCHPRMSFLAWPLIHCQQHYQVAVFRVHAEGKKILSNIINSLRKGGILLFLRQKAATVPVAAFSQRVNDVA